MSQFKHIRQQREYNNTLNRLDYYQKELHKLDSNQQSLFTREFLLSKIGRIQYLLNLN
mgnify:CR=1 FL=1